MDVLAVVLFGIPPLAFGVLLVLSIVSRRLSEPGDASGAFRELAARLAAPAEGPIEIARHERRFLLGYTPPGNKRTELLQLQVTGGPTDERREPQGAAYRGEVSRARVTPRPILLRPESGTDRLGKRLGLNREVQIGDAELDAKVYVETEADDATVREVLADAETRRAVVNLFELGYTRLRLEPGPFLVTAEASPTPPRLLEADAFDRTLTLVHRVAGGLPPLGEAAPEAAIPAAGKVCLAQFLGVIVLAVALTFTSTSWRLLDSAFPMTSVSAFVAWVVAVVIFIPICRGRADGLRLLLLNVGVTVLLAPMLAYFVIHVANATFDHSPAVEHRPRVLKVWSTSGKSTSYYVRLAGWRSGEDDVTIRLSSSEYAEFAGAMTARVVTRAGALGLAWIERLSPRA